MILLINVAKEKLHFEEFVKPVGNILIEQNVKGFIRHYSCLTKKDLEKCDKVIICGTSLKDNDFLDDLETFNWLQAFDKPVLGICAGMQIIGLVYGGRLKKKTEIGYYFEHFTKNFLGLKGKNEVYHLHTNYVDFNELQDFEHFTNNNVSQAVKHTKKKMYGVLFHPEVRNKKIIEAFVNNG